MTATTESLHLPAGSAATGDYALEVTPESAGWGHSSLRVLELPAGGSAHGGCLLCRVSGPGRPRCRPRP